jgi:2,4-dienoyl-CoA reductase-like NADH-dependent reductase (Old Yellow Enzyme family)
LGIYEGFGYKRLEEIVDECKKLEIDIGFSENIDVLQKKVMIGRKVLHNSLAIHPMEGCDSQDDGSPSELTKRRYERFSKSGAGLIWFEATAVIKSGRANPRQLCISEKNLDCFKRLSEDIKERTFKSNNGMFSPLLIMQITHSGRYSRPRGISEPVIAFHDPYLDKNLGIPKEHPLVTDDELKALEDQFVKAARLAEKAGFDGVDVKSCHRYLLSELLAAHTREGTYGGDFEGRTAFLKNVTDKIRDKTGLDFIVTSRVNIYDAMPFPYGFGADKNDPFIFDPDEPVRLVRELHANGMKLINLTMGNPYYNPHVNRPYEKGNYDHTEHPLTGVARLINGIGKIQKDVPHIAVVSTGYSYAREFAPYLAAGSIIEGKAKIIGFGREAFAYPEFARDILEYGGMKKDKCCIACGKCSELMRMGSVTGCVIRDEVYKNIYKELKEVRK